MDKKLIIILFLVSMPIFADEAHHGHHETTSENYTLANRYVNTNGLAAIYAATQIHPSENISGIQLGFGAAQVGKNVGLAAGVAVTVPGRAMFNGSMAIEGKKKIIGLGINLSIKP